MGDKIDMSLDDIISQNKKSGQGRGRGGRRGGQRGGRGGRSSNRGVQRGGVQKRRGGGNRPTPYNRVRNTYS